MKRRSSISADEPDPDEVPGLYRRDFFGGGVPEPVAPRLRAIVEAAQQPKTLGGTSGAMM